MKVGHWTKTADWGQVLQSHITLFRFIRRLIVA
jgi:hypothetical protein